MSGIQPSQNTPGDQTPVTTEEFVNSLSPEEQKALVKLAEIVEYSYDDGTGQTTLDGDAAGGAANADKPEMSPIEAMAILTRIMGEIGSANMDSAQEGIKANHDAQKIDRKERMEAAKKVAEMIKNIQKKGKLSKILGWCGVGLAIVAAIAVTIGTFGAAAPASAAAVIACVGCITGALLATATQVVTSIPGAMEGMGEQGAKDFMMAMMIAQIVVAVISFGAGAASSAGGATATAANVADDAAAAGARAGTVAANTADDAAIAGAKTATTTEKLAHGAETSAKIAEGGVGVAQGVNELEIAEDTKEKEYTEALMVELAKQLKQAGFWSDKEVEYIKVMMEFETKNQQALGKCYKLDLEARQAASETVV